MSTIAAFFDIDGTLYREGMITTTFKKMIRSDVISNEIWYKELKEKYNRWDKRMGNYDDYLLRMAEIYTEAIKGLHRVQVEFIAKKVIEQNGDRVYTYTRDRIKWHKEQGHKVFTISGSPIELVREMSLKHGVDHYVGSTYILDENDCYTGEVLPMWDGENKKKTVDKLVKEYDIDLANSYAYGDTNGDITMFESVGNPVAMNPTRELISLIQGDEKLAKKVKVVVERKDMIYELAPQCIVNSHDCPLKVQ